MASELNEFQKSVVAELERELALINLPPPKLNTIIGTDENYLTGFTQHGVFELFVYEDGAEYRLVDENRHGDLWVRLEWQDYKSLDELKQDFLKRLLAELKRVSSEGA